MPGEINTCQPESALFLPMSLTSSYSLLVNPSPGNYRPKRLKFWLLLRIITLLVLVPYLTPGVTTPPALITTGLLIVTVEPLYVERLDEKVLEEKVLERNWAWQLVVIRVKLIKVIRATDFILLMVEFVIWF